MKTKRFREMTEFEKCIRIERFIYQKFNTVQKLDFHSFACIMKVLKEQGLMDTQITFKLSNEKSLSKDFTEKHITTVYDSFERKGKTIKKEYIVHMVGCESYGEIIDKVVVTDDNRYKMDNVLYLNFCLEDLKPGWNFILKKIETDIDLYDNNGKRIPPTKKELRFNVIGYYKE